MSTHKYSHRQIDGILRQIGFPSHLKGYRFLLDSVYVVSNNKSAIYNISELYGELASLYGVSVSGIERSIRTVIIKAWSEHRDRIYRFTDVPFVSRPTIKQLIAAVSDGINMIA